MKILIVDDNDVKRLRVSQALQEGFDPARLELSEAVDYESAMRQLEGSHFDLVMVLSV